MKTVLIHCYFTVTGPLQALTQFKKQVHLSSFFSSLLPVPDGEADEEILMRRKQLWGCAEDVVARPVRSRYVRDGRESMTWHFVTKNLIPDTFMKNIRERFPDLTFYLSFHAERIPWYGSILASRDIFEPNMTEFPVEYLEESAV